ncbi:MAG: 5'-3' exonuclease [Gordonia sp. (in: high G+C Gram-positive bacteria)]|uniref:5'-3' exonuclease n=1 Tax=Gordonia sp. (in: high G+C Gram-positive bacteria) TaxID=84139 RepID=UPI003BB6FD52
MLLDGASLWFRSFFALPEKMTAPDGRPVNAVRGFLDTIASLVTTHEPTRIVVCLDRNWRPDFRTALIPEYKAHRVAEGGDGTAEEVPDTLTPQVDMILDVLRCAGIETGAADDCEADDVIGTLAVDEAADEVLVVTGDRDLLQLVADDPVSVRVLYVGRGLAKAELMGPAEVAAKYAVPRARAGTAYAEMSMLRGDPSDGLRGVKGIGDKTAAKLITAYGSLDALEAAAAQPDSGISPRLTGALEDAADYLRAARTVVTVRSDAPVEFSRGDQLLPPAPDDADGLAALVEQLGIEASIGRLSAAFGWF